MKKFDWWQVKRFYEARSSHWERGGYNDPDALTNVVMPGEALWVNEYFARSQQMAYQALFDLTPPPRPGARAFDIGCGAGRWARFLSEHGYQTVGIDLQPALIEAARRRYPHIDFFALPFRGTLLKSLLTLFPPSKSFGTTPLSNSLSLSGKYGNF